LSTPPALSAPRPAKALEPCKSNGWRDAHSNSLFIGRGRLAASNAEQVKKIVRILAELGLQPATPAETRVVLKLKGQDRVAL
jgi:hypothetical protein